VSEAGRGKWRVRVFVEEDKIKFWRWMVMMVTYSCKQLNAIELYIFKLQE
jgi:hypothetical protein